MWEMTLLTCHCHVDFRKQRGLSLVQWACYRASPPTVQYLVSYGAKPNLEVRVLWFPSQRTLKEVIFDEFSETIYDSIDLAIYRGTKQVYARGQVKECIRQITWLEQPV